MDTQRGSRTVNLVPPLSAQGLDRFAHFAIYHLPDGHLDVLGAGGMGTTYRAFDLQLERPVALKVIHPQHFYHPDVRARFLREAKAAARLQHPNIAGILYQGEENGICFYAMELVTGEDLQDYVGRVGPMDPVAALQICHQVLLGLDAAYQVHLLHRDLKPANIMLTRYHDHRIPHVKVIDFGLAKFLHDMPATLVTRAGFMGTPGYASPEQCQELSVDCRSDLYSLGATLWFLLTGREIFEGSTLSVIQAHVQNEPDYNSLPMESGPVQYVLQRLLAKKPEDRPETPMHALHDLEYAIEALGGPAASVHHPIEPKLAPPGDPPTLAQRKSSAKTTSPKPILIWLGGGVLALLAIGLFFLFWGRSKTTEEKQFTLAFPAAPAIPSPSGQTVESAPSGQESSQIAPTEPLPKAPEPEILVPAVQPVATGSESHSGSSLPATNAVFNLMQDSAAAPAVTPSESFPALPAITEAKTPIPLALVVHPDAVGEKTNSLGMKLVPLPFLGGDNWISIWETRLKDYRAFANETKRVPKTTPSWKDPRFMQSEEDPVVYVSVEDADAFCKWLTEKEKAAGKIQPYQIYRLPTRLELDVAAGRMPPGIMTQLQQKYPSKIIRPLPQGKYPWGDKWPPNDRAGNFADIIFYRAMNKRAIPKYEDGFANTSPVGKFSANPFGIFDLTGNVWELSSTADGKNVRVGAGWTSFEEVDFSPRQVLSVDSSETGEAIGFRCVLVEETLANAFHPPEPEQNGGPRGPDPTGPQNQTR